jgi:hypothetical protein
MSDRIEYARKVVLISLGRMGKHPLDNVNNFNSDDKERLITTVMDTTTYDNNQIDYAFNYLSMCHVIYPSHKYCYTDYEFEDLDDDFSIYLYKQI